MHAQHQLELHMKRIISEYKFLECTLEEMTFTMESFADSFQAEFQTDIALAASRAMMSSGQEMDVNIETDPNITKEVHNKEDGGHDTSPPNRLARTLYRRLALLLHPDKPTGDVFAFLAVEKAYRDKDTLKLLMMATDVGICVEGMHTMDDNISLSITMLQDKIMKIKNSIAWAWYDVQDSNRAQLRQTIVETLGRFKTQVP